MLYFLHGTDTHTSRQKLHELLDTLEKKRPDASVFRMTSENWSESQFDELLCAQGLFDQKYIVVMDMLCEKKDIKEYVLDRIEQTKDVSHVFLMLEGKVDSATLKKVSLVSVKVQEFTKKEDIKKNSPNVFAITDALVQRDKRKLWSTYIQLLDQGVGPEEIHGILFWQVKNMLLATRAESQRETGLSPFVYKNALTGARLFKEEELTLLSSKFIDMTHRVRQGRGDLDIMLEKVILEM